MQQKNRVKLQTVSTILTFPFALLIILAPVLVYFIHLVNEVNVTALSVFAVIGISFWVLISISSLFLQRAHCSHTCAITGMFTFFAFIFHNPEIMRTKYPRIIYHVVLSLWIIAPLYVYIRCIGNKVGFLPYNSAFDNVFVIIFYSLFLLSSVFTKTTGKSNTAHYICPFSPCMISMIKLGEFLKIPSRKFVTDSTKCVNCGVCAKNCPMGFKVNELVKTNQFNQKECINCGRCIDGCKNKAIECRYF